MSTAPLFHLRGIHFAYHPRRPVLAGAEFRLHDHERVALMGGNGAGKTTLLHLMVGLIRPHAGEVEAFGRVRGAEKDFREVRARAGLLFQDPDDQLFCPTVEEDIAFGPLNLGKSREEALDIVSDTLARLNMSAFANRVTHQLSGGEKRLVSLAAVLAMQPDVLLLDEPTNALDRESWERLSGILTELPQAMVVVSHDHDFLRQVTTRGVCLVDGRLEAVDPPQGTLTARLS